MQNVKYMTKEEFERTYGALPTQQVAQAPVEGKESIEVREALIQPAPVRTMPKVKVMTRSEFEKEYAGSDILSRLPAKKTEAVKVEALVAESVAPVEQAELQVFAKKSVGEDWDEHLMLYTKVLGLVCFLLSSYGTYHSTHT